MCAYNQHWLYAHMDQQYKWFDRWVMLFENGAPVQGLFSALFIQISTNTVFQRKKKHQSCCKWEYNVRFHDEHSHFHAEHFVSLMQGSLHQACIAPLYSHFHNDRPFFLRVKNFMCGFLYRNAENKTRTGAFQIWNGNSSFFYWEKKSWSLWKWEYLDMVLFPFPGLGGETARWFIV